MDSDMVAKVARAIYGSEYLGEFPAEGIAHALELQKARAAIEAMREPTMDMKLAGAVMITAQMPKHGVQADYDAACDSWKAMIDRLLQSRPIKTNGAECMTCNTPPEGWLCSRVQGHEGPCAAVPSAGYRAEWEEPANEPLIRQFVAFADFISDRADEETRGVSVLMIRTVAAALRARAALSEQPSLHGGGHVTEWQPIETAPKDGRLVDLWWEGIRLVDCFWMNYNPSFPTRTVGWICAKTPGTPFNLSDIKAVPTHWAEINPPGGE